MKEGAGIVGASPCAALVRCSTGHLRLRPARRHKVGALLILLLAMVSQESFAGTPGDAISDWLSCLQERYENARESDAFDASALAVAEEACRAERAEILRRSPPEAREAIDDRLASVIDGIEAAANARPPGGMVGYGLNPDTPVTVGGGRDGVKRTLRYFSLLRDSQGRPPVVERIASCCAFEMPDGSEGRLDIYTLRDSRVDLPPQRIYVDTYRAGTLKPVRGFTFVQP